MQEITVFLSVIRIVFKDGNVTTGEIRDLVSYNNKKITRCKLILYCQKFHPSWSLRIKIMAGSMTSQEEFGI